MKKDIIIPEVEDVAVAIVQEAEGIDDYGVYLLNLKFIDLKNVLVVSTGYGILNEEPVKTGTMRHFSELVKQHEYMKIESIQEDVFGITNEYWVSFYINNQIYDKRFIFLAETIIESNFVNLPLVNKRGVLIK